MTILGDRHTRVPRPGRRIFRLCECHPARCLASIRLCTDSDSKLEYLSMGSIPVLDTGTEGGGFTNPLVFNVPCHVTLARVSGRVAETTLRDDTQMESGGTPAPVSGLVTGIDLTHG